jgi:hypothetical protein
VLLCCRRRRRTSYHIASPSPVSRLRRSVALDGLYFQNQFDEKRKHVRTLVTYNRGHSWYDENAYLFCLRRCCTSSSLVVVVIVLLHHLLLFFFQLLSLL